MSFWTDFDWKMGGIGIIMSAISLPILMWAILGWNSFYNSLRYGVGSDLSVIDRGESVVFLSFNGLMLLAFFGLGLIVVSFLHYYKRVLSKKREERKSQD
ncbi:MAG: hypothetical protein ACFE9R_15940 [Candidatus Hermodarchaeota archaeon]